MAIVNVLKYDGGADVFAWKYPNEELGTWTQLVVNETQEAILLKDGKLCDIFKAGRYTLTTNNIPILNKIVNIPFGGSSPFKAEVWYINKIFSLDIKWGTTTPIQLQDPKYGIFVPVRSFGQFGVQVEDASKFLLKLVGTMPVFDKESLQKYFRGFYLTKVKDAISSYLVEQKISIVEISAYLDEISDFLKERLEPIFSEYGIKIISFNVNDVSVPEDDEGVKKLKQALSKKAEMDIVGYSYQQERTFDTLEGAATNPASGQSTFVGAGLGIGMGAGLGGAMGQQFGGLIQNLNTNTSKICPRCHSNIDINVRFCGSCGYDTQKENSKSNGIKCSKCGANIGENSKFCPECGNKYNPCPKCKADIPKGDDKCPVCGAKSPKTCPSCGAIVAGDVKFCPECGQPMMKKCKSCGHLVEDGIKYCPECGKSIK